MQRLQPDTDDAAGPERALTTTEIFAPADGALIGTVDTFDPARIPDLVATARTALGTWVHTAPHDRARILERAAELIDDDADDLATLHAMESGKVIAQARKEVAGAAALLRANAGLARFTPGQLAPTGAVPGGERDLTIVERVPLGVVVCVIPFNFPVELTVEKTAAALAAGNVVILKPPPQNPLATIRTAEAIQRAGLPAGVLQVAPGGRELSGGSLRRPRCRRRVADRQRRGRYRRRHRHRAPAPPASPRVGRQRCLVVLPDADLELVVSETLRGRLLMNGQACAATKRIVAHREIADELTDRLAVALGKVTMGDPVDPASDLGPLIDRASADRVAAQVQRVVSDGGHLVLGSDRPDRSWFAPALIREVPRTAAVAVDDEIFGPVFPLIPVDSDREALDTVNQSSLGLTAAVYSADIGHAMTLAERLRVGGVVINGTNNYRPPVVPFGGSESPAADAKGSDTPTRR